MAVLINGVNYSWGNLTIVAYGNIVIAVTALKYKSKQEKTNNYGLGIEPISRGYGRKEYESSVTLYIDELKKLRKVAPGGDIMQIPASDMQCLWAGSRVLPTKDVLKAFEFLEDGTEASEGDTKLLVEIPLIIGGIEYGGL